MFSILRWESMGALGGQPGPNRDCATLRKQGVEIPVKLNHLGRYVLSAAASGKDSSKSADGTPFSAFRFGRAPLMTRPNSPSGILRLSYEEDGLYRSYPPRAPSACMAFTLREATVGFCQIPRKS